MDEKAPNSKPQHPRKLQITNTKGAACLRLELRGWHFSGAWRLVLGAFMLIVFLGVAAHAGTMTVNVAQKGGSLKKAGLGSLFGIVTNDVDAWKYYMTNSFLFVSEHQNQIGRASCRESVDLGGR